MTKAICPSCGGRGYHVMDKRMGVGERNVLGETPFIKCICTKCHGKGYVEVID